jgi:Reverse transcriptase (RNA-dependent DNA polymerase)
LVKPVLVATANLHPHQYGSKGVPPAIARVAMMMAEGYVFAREIDIKDCFPSFKEENLYKFLPLPKEVIRHVILSEHLTLIGGNLADLFGHAEDGVESPFITDTFVLARRGISQGSAASNSASEILLSKPYFDLPTGVVVVGYADNTLLMGKTEEEAVSIMKAFGASLKKHPVGLLEPKLKGKFNKDDHVDYLGHRLTLVAGKVKIEPHPDHLTEFGREIHRRLVRFKKAANPWQAMNAEHAYRSYVSSWAANFCLCNGVEAMRAKALAKLEMAKAMTS